MMRCVLLTLIFTAHALAHVAPSLDASSYNGSGLIKPEMHMATAKNENKEHHGDYGYQKKPTVNSTIIDRDSISDLRNAEDAKRNESTQDGNVTSICDPDVETYDNVTSGVVCQKSLELSKRHWMETIKRDILSQLGRKSPTDFARPIPEIPELKRWIDLVETGNKIDAHAWDRSDVESALSAKTLTVVAFPSTDPNISRHQPDVPVIYFHLNGTAFYPTTRLTRAHLGVFIRRSGRLARKRSRPESTHINVYRLEAAWHRDRVPSMHRVWSRSIYVTWADTGRWYHFDVLREVEQWLSYPETNHGFLVTAIDSTKTQLALLTARDDYERRYLPYMEIAISDSQRPRPEKRSLLVDDCDPVPSFFASSSYASSKNRDHHCCRHPLVIDFRELGWNWVIAPQRYNAYFCSGICPRFQQRTANPVHSHLLQQAGPAGYHGLCCAPASLAPISIIFFDDQGRVTFREVASMVVTRCSCA